MDNNLNIYLDTIVFRIQRFGGASTYWKELLVNFIKLKHVNLITQSNDITVLNNDGQYVMGLLNDENNKLMVESILPASLLRYLPFTKKLPPKSIYHASYYRTCFQKDVVNIFTVHDFTHKRGYSSKFPRKLVHIGLTAIGLKNADGVICISENTKKDLMLYYPQIPEKKIKVIYHGVSNEFYVLPQKTSGKLKETLNLDGRFILFVGKRRGYKKFDIIPEAIKDIENLKLVIVGGEEFLKNEEDYLNRVLPGRFIKLNNVNNAELNELYNSAWCLVYTSIYEGFGIPLLEAMRAGCPVVTNKLSSLNEVADDAALTIDNVTAEALKEKLVELNDNNLRSSLIEKGLKRSERFTWKKCFDETYQFYKEIYSQKFN